MGLSLPQGRDERAEWTEGSPQIAGDTRLKVTAGEATPGLDPKARLRSLCCPRAGGKHLGLELARRCPDSEDTSHTIVSHHGGVPAGGCVDPWGAHSHPV